MDLHTLQITWFGLIAVLWTGYLVLEGFDFGVGMLLPFLGRNDTERRVLINTIGPVWDGNEVWLITAGGATFAAFPLWYATLFSALYLPLLLVLVALILRGVAFEYRGKIDDDRWRARWDAAILFGSTVPALLWGVAFGAILQGVDEKDITNTPWHVLLGALRPYPLLTGATTLLLFCLHGALFLSLRTTGELHGRARATARRLAPPAVAVAAVWALWTQLEHGAGWTWGPVALAAAGLLGALLLTRCENDGKAFALTCLVIVCAVVTIFGSLYPAVLPINGGTDLTVENASSTELTLQIMTGVAVIFTPVVVAYQSWTYWVFRYRVGITDIPPSTGLAPFGRPRSSRTSA
ncbi:MAG: cytochrome bd ubiquinol oxidase subunit [Actinomycetota bacterium]|nr:cytochrome bd ubiquinol oxidase subunit [Actinomycetota bacterium]